MLEVMGALLVGTVTIPGVWAWFSAGRLVAGGGPEFLLLSRFLLAPWPADEEGPEG
jgi:hypothetical protein